MSAGVVSCRLCSHRVSSLTGCQASAAAISQHRSTPLAAPEKKSPLRTPPIGRAPTSAAARRIATSGSWQPSSGFHRQPPPGRGERGGDALGVEHPDAAHPGAAGAGGQQHVRLGGGAHHRAGCVQDPGNDHRGGLVPAGRGDRDGGVLVLGPQFHAEPSRSTPIRGPYWCRPIRLARARPRGRSVTGRVCPPRRRSPSSERGQVPRPGRAVAVPPRARVTGTSATTAPRPQGGGNARDRSGAGHAGPAVPHCPGCPGWKIIPAVSAARSPPRARRRPRGATGWRSRPRPRPRRVHRPARAPERRRRGRANAA